MTIESDRLWEQTHYRFGLAGEGQADIIQGYLERKPGRVLNIGCGPWGERNQSLVWHCNPLIAADKSVASLRKSRSDFLNWVARVPGVSHARLRRSIAFLAADAESLPIASSSIDCILALGLFADIGYADPATILSEFFRVCRRNGYAIMTNAVAHPIEKYRELGTRAGFGLTGEACGHCPAASGSVKERYLLVFTKP
jgi:ubiquinone/menaquinone biosynthesis C-methylase UbiE